MEAMGMTLNQERYLAVLARHLPRPIESDEDYDHWAEVLEAIDMSVSASEEERMLSALMKPMMEDYDRRQNPELYALDPLGSLKFLLESNGMTQADLARLLGISRTTASQIYNGHRGISKASALKLADRFGLNVSVFLA
jgi:HTH-type transcriptional regulator/antitoxin HigA